MKKFLAASIFALSIPFASACEIETHAKFCVEIASSNDTPIVILIDGKPSTDFTVTKPFGYMKITYNKPITQNLNGEIVYQGKNGKELRRKLTVTTKVINDGSKIPTGMADLLKELTPKGK